MADGIEHIPALESKPKRIYGKWTRHNANCIEAIRLGKTMFDPGEPCENGHLAKRLVAGGSCVQCRQNKRPSQKKKGPRKMPEGDYWIRDSLARAEARSLGQINFIPEKPCKHGHMAPRSVRSGECTDCTTGRVLAWGKTEYGKIRKKVAYVKLYSDEKNRVSRVRKDKYRRDRDEEGDYLKYARKRRGLPAPTRPRPPLCECCSTPSNRRLALDHCHVTGEFRGWICCKCNSGIAYLGDTLDAAWKAVAYLEMAVLQQQLIKNTLVDSESL